MLDLSSSVTLVSSRCIDTYTENTRSSFANTLAAPLETFDENSRVYIQACSLAFSTFIDNDPPPQVVKIHIREVTCQTEDNKSSRCIAILTYPPSEVTPGYALHNFENTLFLPLHNSNASVVRVRLTDENDEELRISRGGDTILHLSLTDDEMKVRGAFTISCSSHHPDLYPGNKLSNFNSPLLTDLHLSGQYEVALQSIIFPPRMYERCVAEMKLDGEVFRYRLSEIADTATFLTNVQMDIIESRLGVELHFEVADGHATLSRGEIAMGDIADQIEVEFNREFCLACGHIIREQKESITLARGQNFTFRGQPDIHLAVPNPVALLESNVVNNSMVADGRLNVLHCVPVLERRDRDNVKLYIPHKLFFRPITDRPLDKIKFKFTNPDGEERNFRTRGGDNGENSKIVITLAFRRQK